MFNIVNTAGSVNIGPEDCDVNCDVNEALTRVKVVKVVDHENAPAGNASTFTARQS